VFDALLDVLGAFWCASEMYLAHWCDVLEPRVLLWVWAVLVMFWGYVSRMLICNFIWNSFGMVWVRVVMYLECVWEDAGDLGVTRQRFGMRSGRNCRCAVFVGYVLECIRHLFWEYTWEVLGSVSNFFGTSWRHLGM
jgi:hypothetical protein